MKRIIDSSCCRMRGKLAAFCAFLAAAILSGCGTASVYGPYRAVDDLDSFLRYGAPDGEAQVEILGNPFNVPQELLAQALLEGFENGVRWGPYLRFSTRSATARPGYRFVIAFGAPPNSWGDDLCRDAKTLRLTPQEQPFRVKAAFCVNERAYSEISGQGGEISGPSDPQFKRWAWNLMQGLTPLPDHRGADNDRPL